MQIGNAMQKKATILISSVACAGLITACGGAGGGDWTDGNVELIVPNGAGSTNDAVARGVADGLQSEFGMNVTVTNREGASGSIGTSELVSAEPDGNTIGFVATNSLLWQPMIDDSLNYSADEGYELLIKAGDSPFAIMVPEDSQWESFDDFIEDADAGEPIDLAVTGDGAQTDLTVGLLNQANDWDINTVPYTDGAGEGMLAAVRGEVDGLVSTVSGVQGLIDSGDGRVLVTVDDKPEPLNPDAESFADYDLDSPMNTTWLLIAPEGLEDGLAEEISEALYEVVQSEEWFDYMENLGLAPDAVLSHSEVHTEVDEIIDEYETLLDNLE